MKQSIDKFISEFGFEDFSEYIASSFKWGISYKPMIISISFGTLSALFEGFIGMECMVFVSFVVLLIIEFITGVQASIKEGKKIKSKKFGRFILKIITYTLMIGIINTFATKLKVPIIFGQSLNIYSWIYYIVLNMIVIQLIISVFENLARLGYSESNKIFKALTVKTKKWFDFTKDEK